MPQPPLEAFVDDAALSGEVPLLRRLRPDWVDWDDLDDHGLPRISGMGFQVQKKEFALQRGYPGPCLSLVLEEEAVAEAESLEALLIKSPGYGLARLSAGALRSFGFGLQLVPEPALDEPWHVAAFHLESLSQAKRAKPKLAASAKLVVVPDPPGP